MMQNQGVKKYLLYAFGEIVLVVLGILIALHLPAREATAIRRQRLWPTETGKARRPPIAEATEGGSSTKSSRKRRHRLPDKLCLTDH